MTKKPKSPHQPRPGKRPRVAHPAGIVGKQPQAIAVGSVYELRPSWRVSSMEMVDRFGWHGIEPDKLREVRSKLGQFETMSWREILLDSKKQNHSVDVDKLILHAQRWLEDHKYLEERLVSLRLSGRERIWGYLAEHGVMVVLWWDPDHEVCPSLLKHT